MRAEYINFDDLLLENLNKQLREQVQWQATAGSRAPLTISIPDTGKRRVVDMSSWVQAYTVYAATVLHWAPERSGEPLGYQALIAQACQNFNNSAVLGYDRELRALASESAGRRLDEVYSTTTKFVGHKFHWPSAPHLPSVRRSSQSQ